MTNISTQPVPETFTQRERDILQLITDGLSNQEVAERLFITLSTVKWYLKQIYGKLGVRSRTQAIAVARSSGLLEDVSPARILTSRLVPVEPSNLPQQPPPFIGRCKELTAIVHRLDDPVCRLITLVVMRE